MNSVANTLSLLLFIFTIAFFLPSRADGEGANGLTTQRKSVVDNPLCQNRIREVALIDIGRLDDPFTKPEFMADCASVTNEHFVAEAVNILASTENQNYPVPFSGVLSYQVFRDAMGDVQAVAQILNTPGSLVVLRSGFVDYERSTEKLFVTSSPEYCRLILDVMRLKCPDRLNLMERYYGKRIEEVILSPFLGEMVGPEGIKR